MSDNIGIINKFFEDLKFNEKLHRYSVNGVVLNNSVSQLIHLFVEEFNKYEISLRMSYKSKKTQEDILEEWETKREKGALRGKIAHDFAEKYFYNRNILPENEHDESIINFYKEMPKYIIPILPEVRMYHKEFLFAGTADLLLKNNLDNTYIIIDYKTNEDLFKNYKGKKMLDSFSFLLDNPFNRYQIQLSLYQILIEQVTGIKISNRKIIWLFSKGKYEMYDTENYCDLLLKYFENESKRLNTKDTITL